jgi:hypothetical protein
LQYYKTLPRNFNGSSSKNIFLNLRKDVYLCLAYISPESLSFNKVQNTDILEEIENDIINKYSKLGNIILTGDFNARTGTEPDYIRGDSTSYIPVDNEMYNIDVDIGLRHSSDKTLDCRGKDLLEMCVTNKLRIANGRSFGDSLGNYTCHNYAGSSVVDCFIVSEELLEDILCSCGKFYTNFRLSLQIVYEIILF